VSGINELTASIIDAAIEVHRHLGPGLLESAYTTCLEWEFQAREIEFAAQIGLPVIYKGRRLNCGFRADFIVGRKVVVEVKAVESITPVHQAQILTYLRLTGCTVGLILNFNSVRMVHGIKRLVHNLDVADSLSGAPGGFDGERAENGGNGEHL
jgi:GxxExxY protein